MTTLDGAVDLARDRVLVERCQGGDDHAFAELYGRYQQRLYRFCLRRVHSPDDAEEAAQEAFARAWRALPSFAGERRFYPWLTVIAGNVCTDMLRRRSRLVPMGDVPAREVDLSGPEVDERLLRQVDVAMASEALGKLSDRHRRVLRLREGTEWSAQRIGESEGLETPAVDTLLWRARQAFKRELAALSETGGFAAVLGLGVAGLRRGVGRLSARVGGVRARLSSMVSVVGNAPRASGAIVASVAMAGTAIAGGTVAVVDSATHATRPHAAGATSSMPGVPGSGASGSPAGATNLASAASGVPVALGHGGGPDARLGTTAARRVTVLGTLVGWLAPAGHASSSRTASPQGVGTGVLGAVVTVSTSTLEGAASSAETALRAVTGSVLGSNSAITAAPEPTAGSGTAPATSAAATPTTTTPTTSSGAATGASSASGGVHVTGATLTVPAVTSTLSSVLGGLTSGSLLHGLG